MPSLKILFVVDGLWVGGTERSLAELLPYLNRAGISPVIACFNRYSQEGVENEVTRKGFEVNILKGKGLMSRVWALRRLIEEKRPDILHTSLFGADVTGRLAAVGLPVTVMGSLVNTPYEPVRYADPRISRKRLRAVQTIDAWTSRHLTAHLHAVSQAAKDAAVRALGLPPERITVVERGRDPQRLGEPGPARRLRARARLGLKPDDTVLVNVGRQEYQKGQRYLLEAMAEIIKTYPRLTLLVAGRSGHASSELKGLQQRLNLNDRARFLGHQDDVPEILAAADLFVFPSLYEGLPGAVIEAMALGLPIAAADIAPVREVVEEGRNALLFDPASSVEIVAAVDALLTDAAKAADFGRRSREIFEERFTIERSASRMIAMYYQVASCNRIPA